MKISAVAVSAFRIEGAPALDPILVITQEWDPGQGRIIIECYGQAWSAYWGAMGSQDLASFVAGADVAYLAERLAPGRRLTKPEVGYLTRIVTAVQEAFKQRITAQTDGPT